MNSTRKRISPGEERTNVVANGWPVRARDPIHDARPDAPIVRDPVVAVLAFLDRAQTLHRTLRPLVELVRLQPDAVRAEVLEQVPELQELHLGVRDGAARLAPEEGPADLGGLVVSVDVREARAADGRAVAGAAREEHDLVAEGLLLERRGDPALELPYLARHRHEHEAPDVVVVSHGKEVRRVLATQPLEP